MKIQLKFFASVREQLGVSVETVEFEAGLTAFAVRELLMQRGDVWAAALSHQKVLRIALNQEMLQGDQPLKEGDELAFFPPVTGG
mgnify:CR=1 FL=1